MTWTQAETLTRTRDRLSEASARQWSDDMLRRWINDGVRDIARRAECMEATATVTGVVNTQAYSLAALSPQIARIHRVEWNDTGGTQVYPLEYEDYGNLDSVWGTSKTVTRARPEIWTAWGAVPNISLVLYPTPSIGGTIRLYFYSIPNRLAETTTADAAVALSIPEGWEDLVAAYVEYNALRRDRDQRWQEAKQIYDEDFQALLNMTSRHSDQSGRIVPNGRGGVPAWLAGGGGYY